MSSRANSSAESNRNFSQKRMRGFSLLELLVVVVIVAALVMLFLPFRRNARGAAQRMSCQNNLKQIGLALHNYHSAYGSLPPAFTLDEHGSRLHSWRTLLLPFLEEDALYNRIDLSKPWNDPKNLAAFQKKIPAVYCCPASNHGNQTQYLAVVDPEGCFTGLGCVSFSAISDGEANTLLVLEVPEGSGVEWMSPMDADWGLVEALGSHSKWPHSGVCQYLRADGAVREASVERQPVFERSMLTIAAGDKINDELE